MWKSLLRGLLSLGLIFGAASRCLAQGLTVAAASDLQSALPAIASQFETATGQPVRLTFGSSGNFFTQIQNGAPFDLFLSADIDYPRRLETSGSAERGSLYRYAVGRIVLWTRSDSGIDVTRGLSALTDGRVRRIAIANPEHAPYGRAAVAALRHEGLYDRVKGKLVLGENISQAAQFADSGSADVGILALALALSPALKKSGSYFEVPESWHSPIEQGAVVLASSRQKALAGQFIEYLKTPDIVRMLAAYGFAVPRAAR
jgi:molybdate transport system substrate-binding protein